ncbi:MAG TPA: hypothetical protein PLQ54_02915, partial [Armatimonadota bacterium]|nr:hypothetical protein [Armatimonadota bacterium]
TLALLPCLASRWVSGSDGRVPANGGIPLGRALAVLACVLSAAPSIATTPADRALAQELTASFSRTTSRVSALVLDRFDRAGVELAAYDRNRVFHYPLDSALKEAPAIGVAELDLGGALVPGSVVDTVVDTPLTANDLAQAMAWRALTKYLSEWDWEASEPLLAAEAKVAGETWGNGRLPKPLQQLAVAYLHEGELWAKVEFRPELTWVRADDEDGDGYAEVYGRVDPGPSAEAILREIRDNYLGPKLSAAEIETVLLELASDWYGELQTIVLDPPLTRPWPNEETEPDVRDLLGGRVFEDAFAVLRSKPYGEPIYNVILLGSGDAVAGPEDGTVPDAGEAFGVGNPWATEPVQFGGTWDAWAQSLGPFTDDVRAQLDARPAELKALIGREGWLFFRGDLEYLLSGELRGQPDERDPYPAIVDFRNQLAAKGIDLLVVFIPTKAEVYPERISAAAPPGARPYVAPYCRKLMAELAEAGVELVDLLPAFIDARAPAPDALYQDCDAHWTNRAVRLAASRIAERVRRYDWYDGLAGQPEAYTTRPATFRRRGDLCDMLAPDEKLAFRPQELTALQVVGPDGQLYVDDPSSPIVVLGDSFTGVFELEDCQHAGLTAHLARELGVPVDLVMAQGSGPTIRGQFVRRGAEAIARKKLVIWTVVSRDLYHYWSPWKSIRVP